MYAVGQYLFILFINISGKAAQATYMPAKSSTVMHVKQ